MGTEICPTHTNAPIMCQSIEQLKDCNDNSQQQMWFHLTGTTCYGNKFANVTQYSKLEKPMYLKVSPIMNAHITVLVVHKREATA